MRRSWSARWPIQLIRNVCAYVATQLSTAAATNRITITVRASVSPPRIPSSIALPARYGGASAAAVASVSATSMRKTFVR